MICDIEGAEIYILKEDKNALDNCQQIIIELHDTSYGEKIYKIDELIPLIEELGFRKLDVYAGNLVFTKA